MVESLGNINTLPELGLPYQKMEPSIVHTRATNNCILSQAPTDVMITQPAKSLLSQIISFLNDFPNEIKNAPETIIKIPEKISETAKKGDEKAKELLDKKLTSLINPNPQPTPKFPIDVEHLSPKMKIAVLNLYYYAQQEGINFTINDGYRTKEQQAELKKTSIYAATCSPHVREIAIDIHIEGKSIEDAQPDLKKLGDYWKKLTGGRWGGDWHGKDHEPWHFDLKHKKQRLCLKKSNNPQTPEGV